MVSRYRKKRTISMGLLRSLTTDRPVDRPTEMTSCCWSSLSVSKPYRTNRSPPTSHFSASRPSQQRTSSATGPSRRFGWRTNRWIGRIVLHGQRWLPRKRWRNEFTESSGRLALRPAWGRRPAFGLSDRCGCGGGRNDATNRRTAPPPGGPSPARCRAPGLDAPADNAQPAPDDGSVHGRCPRV